jgi:fatty-acyl-CoA synthase
MPKAVATLADIEEMEKIPLKDRNLPASTYAAIKRSAEQHPNQTALGFFLQATEYENAVMYNYTEFLGKINQTANMLHDLGVGRNDVVSYILPNLPQTYFTLFGSEAVGISNPINPLLEPHVMAEIMNAAKTKVLVTIANFPKTDVWEQVSSIVNDVPTLETIITVDLAGFLSGIKKVIVSGLRIVKGSMSTKDIRAKVIDFDSTAKKYPNNKLNFSEPKATDIAAYFHTGGTTGTPKLAMHTHENQVFDGWAAGLAIGGESGKMTYLGLPLFHNFGAIAIGVQSFVYGCGIIMGTPSGFRGEGTFPNFWKIVEHYKINLFGGVPTVYKELLNHPVNADISSLEMANCGAAPLPVELANQFAKHAGISILEGYGLTEATSVCSVNPRAGEPKYGSIGYRLPYQEMVIAELEDGEFTRMCDDDEVGVVIIRGPNVFAGYNDDFYNQGAYVDTGDGKGLWLNSGDMGRRDKDGYFWLTGRKKELIIRGGHNIDPQIIEETLMTHPAVALVAAVGKPDSRVGEMPVAYVELKPGASATSSELEAYAAANIGERAAVPKSVTIVDVIPLTAVGKIFKPALTRQLVKEVYEGEIKKIAGVQSVDVTAEGDKRLGTLARINVTTVAGQDKAAIEETIRAALVSYTVHYNLNVN